MQAWEYRFVDLDRTGTWRQIAGLPGIERMFEDHGRDGWEYMGEINLTIASEPIHRFVFKRPLGT